MAKCTEESFIPATKEYEVLQRKTSRLQTAISDPILLSIDLFSKNLVSHSTLQKVNVPATTRNAQNYEIIDSLLQAVAIDPKNFHKLLQVLEGHPPLLTVVGKEMKEDYESCTSSQEQEKVISVDGQNMQNECDEILGRLAGLVFDFQKVVEKANVNIEDLKQYVILRYPDEQYRNELRKASDTNEVFVVIRSKFCSLFNYTVLLRIAEKFNLPDGFKVIGEYKVKEDEYRKLLSSSSLASELKRENELLGQNLSHTQRIIIKLQRWSRPPAPTVAEFWEVIKNVFADLGDLLHLLEVEEGSIIITMCAPERVTGALIALAKKSITYLKNIGVTWLKVGDNIIIEDTEELSHYVIEQDKLTSKMMKNNQSAHQLASSTVATVSGRDSQLFRLIQAADDAGDAKGTRSDSSTPLADQARDHYVIKPREVMIIGTKLSDKWRKEEVKKISDLYKKERDKYHIRLVYHDLPENEHTKEYYMLAIKHLLITCKQPGALIHYTGYGEMNTGNWCFKDGVISFNDIFELYLNHFKGKPLTIVSDCSYSDNWINECGKRLDEMNIPLCGLVTREQGLLFELSTTFQPAALRHTQVLAQKADDKSFTKPTLDYIETTEKTTQELQDEDITPLHNNKVTTQPLNPRLNPRLYKRGKSIEIDREDAPCNDDKTTDVTCIEKRTKASTLVNDIVPIPYGTISVIVIRQVEFNDKCLRAVLPHIKLSYTPGRQQVRKTVKKLHVAGNNEIIYYDHIAMNDTGLRDEAYRKEIECLYKMCSDPDLIIFCTSIPTKMQSPKRMRESEKNAIKALAHFFGTEVWTNTLFFFSKETLFKEQYTRFTDRLRNKTNHLTECVSKTYTGSTTTVPIKYIWLESKTFVQTLTLNKKTEIINKVGDCCTTQVKPILCPYLKSNM